VEGKNNYCNRMLILNYADLKCVGFKCDFSGVGVCKNVKTFNDLIILYQLMRRCAEFEINNVKFCSVNSENRTFD
jgi:hypothetical protein